MLTIGIIGGSGLYAMDGLTDVREVEVETPFGAPSDVVVAGRLGGTQLLFLPRHGRGHRLLPSELPFRANVWAVEFAELLQRPQGLLEALDVGGDDIP